MQHSIELATPSAKPFPWLMLNEDGTVQFGNNQPVTLPKLAYQQWLPSELDGEAGFLLTNRSTNAVEKFTYNSDQRKWHRTVIIVPLSLKSTHNGLTLKRDGSFKHNRTKTTYLEDQGVEFISEEEEIKYYKPLGQGQPILVRYKSDLEFSYLYLNSEWFQALPFEPASRHALQMPEVDFQPDNGPLTPSLIPIGSSGNIPLGPVKLYSNGAIQFGEKSYGPLQAIKKHSYRGYTASRGFGWRRMLLMTPDGADQETFMLRYESGSWYRYLPTTGRRIDYLISFINEGFHIVAIAFDCLWSAALIYALIVLGVFFCYCFLVELLARF